MLAQIPLWVPPVFLALLYLGYRQSFARAVKPSTLLAVAVAMFGFSLYGVIVAFGAVPLPVALWAVAYAAAAFGGVRLLSSSRMAIVGSSVLIPGSWVPMALILSIFAAKFTLGFAAGVHAAFLNQAWFIATMSGLLGALSGGFGARALAVRRRASAGAA